jgi:hypothetical protein
MLVTITPVGLPWKTLLTLSGSVVNDEITTTENSERFGFSFTCLIVGNECSGTLELAKFVKNISTGSEFNLEEARRVSCTVGEGFYNARGLVVLGFLVN